MAIELSIPFITATYFDNTLLAYLQAFGMVILGFLVARTFVFFDQRVIRKLAKKNKFNFDDIVLNLAEKPFTIYMICAGFYIGWGFLTFPNYPDIDRYIGHLLYLVVALNSAWLLTRVIRALIENYLQPLAGKTDTDLDDTLIPILKKLVSISIYAIAVIIILNHFGQEIGPMLAGLGIGGLAFALASKDILANIFGSITVLMDKPFKIGDRIKVNGIDGIVQEISIRTTRIKTLDNTMVYVPNAKFTDSSVENVTQEPARKVMMNIGLVYDTSNVKMKRAISILEKLLSDHKGLDGEHKVAFTEFGDSALSILVIYYIKDKKNILPIRHEINMAIKEKFEKAGLDMAYPTQTVLVKKTR